MECIGPVQGTYKSDIFYWPSINQFKMISWYNLVIQWYVFLWQYAILIIAYIRKCMKSKH
jgi:hypothetical protein